MATVLFAEPTSNSTETTFVTLLIPLFHPKAGANRFGVLTQRLAGVVVTLLGTQQPLVVTIPAMQGLVLTGEAFVTGCCTNGLDLVEASRLFLVELGRLRCENLPIKKR
jgi:hypothetical protein